jgi:hypothetical protein
MHADGPVRAEPMRRLCRLFLIAFGVLYLLALATFVVGTFGLFGEETDPLAGVFLIPLGLPWNRLVDVFPEPIWSWLAAAAPFLNLVLVWLLCRWLSRRRPG